MPYVTLPGGIRAHVKMARSPRSKCCVPGCTVPAGLMCDYAIGAGRTCDARICAGHATTVGPDVDHCPTHSGKQAGLFTRLMP